MPDEPAGREAEVLKGRRESLERLRAKGIEPFALTYEVSATAAEIRERHGDLGAEATTDDEVSVAGRVVLARRFGKLTFFTLRDRSGDIQLFCDEGSMDPASFALLDEIDLGDIVGARGTVMTTKKGELSVRVDTLVLLTKALRPLPEKWHGLKDPDLQQRKRYLHLATDLRRSAGTRSPGRRSFGRSGASSMRAGSSRSRRRCCSRWPAGPSRGPSLHITWRSIWI